MNEDQIIARARQEVALRRAVSSSRPGPTTWLPMALIAATLLAFFAAPAPMYRKLLLAMGGVCGLRPGHSYFVGGLQLPLESRMMGIYGGFLLALGTLLVFRRAGARSLGGKPTVVILALMFTSMVADGVNSTLFEFGFPHLYAPTNALRLITGLLSGIAVAPFLLWLVGGVAGAETALRHEAVVRSPADLLPSLALAAAFALLVMSGPAAAYYPLAIIVVAGITAVLAGVALLVVLSLGGMAGRIVRPAQLVQPGAVALVLAFAILATTAAIRWSTVGPM